MNANIGKLNSGKCYVYLNGYKAEPFWGTEAECEAAIFKHGVADPIPVFCDGVDLTTSKTGVAVQPVKKARRISREYVLTFKAADGSEDDTSGHVENVFARDRNEVMRKGRDIVRENSGPYGPKVRISARLA
ncbi:hypothetical protein [Pseudomonas sp. UMAB-40]|uniref:hypothetical protein n=1 Tax=Pseudomonas sp. UMAB-40 TaxID=1365407 RepID=UPI001C569AE8|nr:hypothetical protein [Pseudomonas sp. UMAB-40]